MVGNSSRHYLAQRGDYVGAAVQDLNCEREIELLQKQLDALKEQKRGLMQKLLPFFYSSKRTDLMKLDGLKVFPDDSELREFARRGLVEFKTEQPTLL